MANEIMTQDATVMQLAQNMQILKARLTLLKQATKEVLVDGVDYGTIPGAGDKPTLLKPGAEKLSFLFGLRPTFELRDSIEDWNGGLFYYRYACILHNPDGEVLANGEGSCNSREVKYRYRNGERKCPHCGKASIIKGKSEYGGGWVCFAKKGGCGAKFADGDPAIEKQEVGKIENPEPFDVVNTLQKMAQKRALIAAVLVGAGASQFFTQDVEDMAEFVDVVAHPVNSTPPEPEKRRQAAQRKPVQQKQESTQEAADTLFPQEQAQNTDDLRAKRQRATQLWREAKKAGVELGAYTDANLDEWLTKAEEAIKGNAVTLEA